MKKTQIGVISLFAVIVLIAFICAVFADTGVPAVPEIQGLATGTSSNVIGTVTETDSGAWMLTNDPITMYVFTFPPGTPRVFPGGAIPQLIAAGGSFGPDSISIPTSLLDQLVAGGTETWGQVIPELLEDGATETTIGGGLHTGVLDPEQVQYTVGYNDQYSGISGQQTFVKSMAASTANTLADQSNIKANTNIQFIAIDTGRATRTEDLLLDGAAQAINGPNSILCPFVAPNPSIIPAFCNIEQAGSAFDTTLTSTVTSADTRFVGTEASIPVLLNYNINSEGLTVGSQSSPMIGSVSAYLKVHAQEARNQSTSTITVPGNLEPGFTYSVTLPPTKSEDLVYSETSSASGLISEFSKSMSYSSQASAVPFSLPAPILPNFD